MDVIFAHFHYIPLLILNPILSKNWTLLNPELTLSFYSQLYYIFLLIIFSFYVFHDSTIMISILIWKAIFMKHSNRLQLYYTFIIESSNKTTILQSNSSTNKTHLKIQLFTVNTEKREHHRQMAISHLQQTHQDYWLSLSQKWTTERSGSCLSCL